MLAAAALCLCRLPKQSRLGLDVPLQEARHRRHPKEAQPADEQVKCSPCSLPYLLAWTFFLFMPVRAQQVLKQRQWQQRSLDHARLISQCCIHRLEEDQWFSWEGELIPGGELSDDLSGWPSLTELPANASCTWQAPLSSASPSSAASSMWGLPIAVASSAPSMLPSLTAAQSATRSGCKHKLS